MSAGEQLDRARDSEVHANLMSILRRRWMVMAGSSSPRSPSASSTSAKRPSPMPPPPAWPSRAARPRIPPCRSRPAEANRSAKPNTEVLLAHSRAVAEGVRSQLHSTASRQRTARRSRSRSGRQRGRPEHHRDHRRPAELGTPRKRLRGAVHRVPGQIAALRHRTRADPSSAADRLAPRRLAPEGAARRIRPETERPEGGCGRWRQRDRARRTRQAGRQEPLDDDHPQPGHRSCPCLHDRLPARVARPADQVARGVRAPVPAAGAERDSPVGLPHAPCRRAHRTARALPHPAKRAGFRRRDAATSTR